MMSPYSNVSSLWVGRKRDGDRVKGEMKELGGHDTNFYFDSPHFCPVVGP
jgi:hypothetical protein